MSRATAEQINDVLARRGDFSVRNSGINYSILGGRPECDCGTYCPNGWDFDEFHSLFSGMGELGPEPVLSDIGAVFVKRWKLGAGAPDYSPLLDRLAATGISEEKVLGLILDLDAVRGQKAKQQPAPGKRTPAPGTFIPRSVQESSLKAPISLLSKIVEEYENELTAAQAWCAVPHVGSEADLQWAIGARFALRTKGLQIGREQSVALVPKDQDRYRKLCSQFLQKFGVERTRAAAAATKLAAKTVRVDLALAGDCLFNTAPKSDHDHLFVEMKWMAHGNTDQIAKDLAKLVMLRERWDCRRGETHGAFIGLWCRCDDCYATDDVLRRIAKENDIAVIGRGAGAYASMKLCRRDQ